jgi:hypothetical protein
MCLSLASCKGSDEEETATATATAPSPAPAGNGSVTVSWMAPVQNEDGTPLVNLAGFRLRYGPKYGVYSNEVTVANAGATSHRVTGLAPGLHYFVVSALNQTGAEGTRSKPQRVFVN